MRYNCSTRLYPSTSVVKKKKTLRNIAFILLTIKNINIKKFTLKVKIDLHAHYKYCKKFNSLENICIVKKITYFVCKKYNIFCTIPVTHG